MPTGATGLELSATQSAESIETLDGRKGMRPVANKTPEGGALTYIDRTGPRSKSLVQNDPE